MSRAGIKDKEERYKVQGEEVRKKPKFITLCPYNQQSTISQGLINHKSSIQKGQALRFSRVAKFDDICHIISVKQFLYFNNLL